VKILYPLMAIGVMAGAARAQDLSWPALAARPELWPTQCTVLTAIRFQSGPGVPAGTKVEVVDFKGNAVDLRTADGKTYFDADPDETDVLDVARAEFQKLTPRQKQLTYPSIVQNKELWPYKVTITRGFVLAPGKAVQAGDHVLVKDVQAGKVDVVSEKLNARFAVAFAATDLMSQARVFVEDAQAGPRLLAMQRQADAQLAEEQRVMAEKIKAEGRVNAELEGKLVNSVTDKPEPLDSAAWPQYIVFLRGSTTCPITRNFTPSLVKYYDEMKAAHPEVEVVYLTLDSLPVTSQFAREMGFTWRAVSYDDTTMPSLYHIIDGRIPQLIVMSKDGKVLANGIQATAPAALQQLEAILRRPAAVN
jgi:hypothetical protein